MTETNQRPSVLWFTGCPAAGKTTLVQAIERALSERGHRCRVLDGDELRTALNADLGYSDKDRSENVRRVAEVAKLFADADFVVLVALISPLRSHRDMARSLFVAGQFVEIYVDAPLEVCMARDPKGLYRRVRDGEIKGFTGIDAPYEVPLHPELHVETHRYSVSELVNKVLSYMETEQLIN